MQLAQDFVEPTPPDSEDRDGFVSARVGERPLWIGLSHPAVGPSSAKDGHSPNYSRPIGHPCCVEPYSKLARYSRAGGGGHLRTNAFPMES